MKLAAALLVPFAALLAVALAVRGPAGGAAGALAPAPSERAEGEAQIEAVPSNAGFPPRAAETPPASAEPAPEPKATTSAEPGRAPAEVPAARSLRDELARARILERARSHADALGLAAGAQERIARVLLEADARGAELRRRARELGARAEGREELRVDAAELRDWRNQALELEFGRELGARIVALEEAPMRLGDAPGVVPSAEGEASGPVDR